MKYRVFEFKVRPAIKDHIFWEKGISIQVSRTKRIQVMCVHHLDWPLEQIVRIPIRSGLSVPYKVSL